MIKKAVFLFFCFWVPGTTLQAANQYALLVGVNDTTQSAVKWAENDVRLMDMHLKRLGFDVDTLINENATQKAIVQNLNKLVLNKKDGDLLLFYFSGKSHHTRDDKGNEKVRYEVWGGWLEEWDDIESIFFNANSNSYRLALIDSCNPHRAKATFSIIEVLERLEKQVFIKPSDYTYENPNLKETINGESLTGFGIFTYSIHQALKEKLHTSNDSVSLFELLEHTEKKYKNNLIECNVTIHGDKNYIEYKGDKNVLNNIVMVANPSSTAIKPAVPEYVIKNKNKIISKVIGNKMNTVAYQEKSIYSQEAFKLEMMKHYFVLKDGTDNSWFHIENFLGNKQTGYVLRSDVVEWNTREAFIFKNKQQEDSIPKIDIWNDYNKLKKYTETDTKLEISKKYGPDYESFTELLEKDMQDNLRIYTFPLLQEKILPKTKHWVKTTAYQVFFPLISPESFKVDIALVVDCSLSMQPYINKIRTELESLLIKVEETEELDISVAVIGYRDLPDPNVIMLHNFESISSAIKRVGYLVAEDLFNKTTPEAMYDAVLAALLHLPWRDKSSRFMVVVPNTRSHVKTIGTKYTEQGKGVADIVAKANDQHVTINGIQAGENDYEAYLQIKYLSDESGGIAYESRNRKYFCNDFNNAVQSVVSDFSEAFRDVWRFVFIPKQNSNSEASKNGVSIQQGWLTNISSLEKCVLFSETELNNMIRFLQLVSNLGVSDMGGFKQIMIKEVESIIGQPIEDSASTSLYDVYSRALGIRYKTDLLDLIINKPHWFAKDQEEDLFRAYTEAAQIKTNKLIDFQKSEARWIGKEGFWVPVELLP